MSMIDPILTRASQLARKFSELADEQGYTISESIVAAQIIILAAAQITDESELDDFIFMVVESFYTLYKKFTKVKSDAEG